MDGGLSKSDLHHPITKVNWEDDKINIIDRDGERIWRSFVIVPRTKRLKH